jgi:hypothetical protein
MGCTEIPRSPCDSWKHYGWTRKSRCCLVCVVFSMSFAIWDGFSKLDSNVMCRQMVSYCVERTRPITWKRTHRESRVSHLIGSDFVRVE